MNQDQRIVITGMGVISPLGLNSDETFENLVAGRTGIHRISSFDPDHLQCQIAGEVQGFNPVDHMDRKLSRRIGRYAQFAIAAAREAMEQAQLDLEQEIPERIGCIVSSAIGDFPMLEDQMKAYYKRGKDNVSPFTVPRVSSSMAAGNIALEFGFTGVGFGLSSACSTGSHSLATAYMLLKQGLADVVLAGGTEAAICETFIKSYSSMRALSTRNDEPERASRPFDRDRDGFVISEGCGVFVLETLDRARRRGAPVLAELAGIGMTCDAFHITSAHPDGQGAAQAMAAALKSAGLTPADVDYVNAHGTSTPVNDPIETNALHTVFGDDVMNVPVSSTKSMTGHAIGAAGAMEAAICIKTLETGLIPPTINLENPSEDCRLNHVANTTREADVSVAMSNSFAFGGQNCVLILRKPG